MRREGVYLSEEIRALDIQIHSPLEIALLRLFERAHQSQPRVGDQDIDLAAPSHCLGDQTLDLLDVACVCFDGDGVVGADFLHQLVGGLGVGGIVDDDFRAEGCEFERCCGADAFGGAGDEGDFAGERCCGGHVGR